jgi:hypothetical protein
MSPTKRWIEDSDEVWNLFKSVFDPRLELGTMRIAVVKELGELSKLGVDYASTALRGVESGKYDPTIKDAVAISVSELADVIMELEAVK